MKKLIIILMLASNLGLCDDVGQKNCCPKLAQCDEALNECVNVVNVQKETITQLIAYKDQLEDRLASELNRNSIPVFWYVVGGFTLGSLTTVLLVR